MRTVRLPVSSALPATPDAFSELATITPHSITMSWVFGSLCAHMRPDHLRWLAARHPAPAAVITTPHLYIAVGGIAGTHAFESIGGSDGEREQGWVVCGLGLALEGEGCRPLGRRDWRGLLAGHDRSLQAVDGHYIAMRYNGDAVEFFSDPLGMRTVYLAGADGETLFSTRLDWLARASGRDEIVLEDLGSHWLLANQLAPASMVRGIERLPAGGVARCTPGTIALAGQPWTPGENRSSDAECIATISAFLNPRLPDGQALALGLSGGMDSRTLLALLVGKRHPFSTYVVGGDDDPDVHISRAIAGREKLRQLHLHAPIPAATDLVPMVEQYASETCAIEPAHSALKFHYPELHARGLVLVDGGLGEIGRRQYMKRLVVAGRGAMRRGRPEEILPFLAVHRAALMQPGAAALMRRGALAELDAVWRSMPPVETIGEENFADLLTIRTRFPNYGGREQSRTDGLAMSYMPFAQPATVSCLMRLPPARRRNGRLFSSIIRTYRPSLAALPVVKDGIIYPLRFPHVAAWGYRKLLRRLGMAWHDPAPFTLLAMLEEYIRDIVASRDVREYAPYDHPRIGRMVDAYYAGDCSHAHELSWWLSFDAWRRGLAGT